MSQNSNYEDEELSVDDAGVIEVHRAEIEHRHGVNTYAGTDKQEVDRKVAEYCRTWWKQEFGDEDIPESPEDMVHDYFDRMSGNGEYLTTSSDKIRLPEPYASVGAWLRCCKMMAAELLKTPVAEYAPGAGLEGAEMAVSTMARAGVIPAAGVEPVPVKSVSLKLLELVMATGGLVATSKGMLAPAADPEWTDLGALVAEVAEQLGVEIPITDDSQ